MFRFDEVFGHLTFKRLHFFGEYLLIDLKLLPFVLNGDFQFVCALV